MGGEMKFEIDLNDIFSPYEDDESAADVIKREVVKEVAVLVFNLHKKTIEKESYRVLKEIATKKFDDIIKEKTYFSSGFYEGITANSFTEFVKIYVKELYGKPHDFRNNLEGKIKESTSKEMNNYVKQSSETITKIMYDFKTEFNSKVGEVLSKQFKVDGLLEKLFQQHVPAALANNAEIKKT